MSANPVPGVSPDSLVEIRDLVIGIQRTRKDRLIIVDSANFDIRRAETLASWVSQDPARRWSAVV